MKFFSILAALYASAAVMALPLNGAGSEVELLEKRMPLLEGAKNHVKAFGKGVKAFGGKKEPGESRKYNFKEAHGTERDQLKNKQIEEEEGKAQGHRNKQNNATTKKKAKKQGKKATKHETKAKEIEHKKWDQSS